MSSAAVRFIARKCGTGAANCAVAWKRGKLLRFMGTLRGSARERGACALPRSGHITCISHCYCRRGSSSDFLGHTDFTTKLLTPNICVSKRLITTNCLCIHTVKLGRIQCVSGRTDVDSHSFFLFLLLPNVGHPWNALFHFNFFVWDNR
jgi:hypothetical protein